MAFNMIRKVMASDVNNQSSLVLISQPFKDTSDSFEEQLQQLQQHSSTVVFNFSASGPRARRTTARKPRRMQPPSPSRTTSTATQPSTQSSHTWASPPAARLPSLVLPWRLGWRRSS